MRHDLDLSHLTGLISEGIRFPQILSLMQNQFECLKKFTILFMDSLYVLQMALHLNQNFGVPVDRIIKALDIKLRE